MKFFSKDELEILWPFYVEPLLGNILYISVPFIVLYFSSLGFTSFQIGILLAAGPLASLVFEIPTGAFADLYGRKISVLFGWMITGILFFFMFFFHNFYVLILLMFLIGLSQTFVSGAYDAWIVDLLNKNRKQKLVHEYFIKRQSLMNLGLVFAGIIGAFAVENFGINIIWPISGISFFIAVLLLLPAKEKYSSHKLLAKNSFKSVAKQTKESVNYSYRHHVLYFLLFISFILGISAYFEGFISWTPLLQQYNFPDYAFGYLWSLIGIIGIIAPFLSKKFLAMKFEKRLLIFVALCVLIYSMSILFIGNIFWLVLIVLLSYFMVDFKAPIWNSYFHRFIPSKMRGTIGSIEVMTLSFSGIIAMPVAGLIVDNFGAKWVIFASGLLMIPVIFLYLRIKEKKVK